MSDHQERFRALMHHAHLHGPSDETVELMNILEVVMEAIDTIQVEFDQYKQDVAASFTAVDTTLSNFEAKVTALQTDLQNAGVDPTKAAALAADIADARSIAQAEIAKVSGSDPGTTGTAPTPSPAPTDPTPPAAPVGTTAPAAEMTLYTTTNDPATIDGTEWPSASVQTTDTPPQNLYTFSGDTSPGEQNGSTAPNWTVYSGPTQPKPTT